MACRGSAVRIRYAPFSFLYRQFCYVLNNCDELPLSANAQQTAFLSVSHPTHFHSLINTMAIVGKELAIACALAAEGIQAEDIRIIELTGLSTVTDFMVVCTGTSLPHIKAILRDIDKGVFSEHHVHANSSDGDADSRWVILDYIDVMVHIMHQEMRDLYGLEDLWSKGKEVEWSDSE